MDGDDDQVEVDTASSLDDELLVIVDRVAVQAAHGIYVSEASDDVDVAVGLTISELFVPIDCRPASKLEDGEAETTAPPVPVGEGAPTVEVYKAERVKKSEQTPSSHQIP